jgi:phosphatidate cytidylyltransferase
VNESGPTSAGAAGAEGRNLLLRIGAALVLAPLAVVVAYAGGWLWTGFATLAAIGLYAEWLNVIAARHLSSFIAGLCIVVVMAWLEAARMPSTYLIVCLVLGVAMIALLAPPNRRIWSVVGLCYALAASMASIALRHDEAFGFVALMFVLLVVWSADIGGYFAGRQIGGPKLWPRISPKKTWAGSIGGLSASLAVAAVYAAWGLGEPLPMLILGAALSIISQLGDLFESAVKRRFGVKDSSHLIPGHGGLMDRLDGFVAAAVAAAILGFLRGGADGVGRGLMVW